MKLSRDSHDYNGISSLAPFLRLDWSVYVVKKVGEEAADVLGAYQIPTILAFRRIVRQQRAPNGRKWYPKRILEELWELWSDRPADKGARKDFIEGNLQRVFRLRSGTVDSIRDKRVYELVERFVAKHALPGDFTPPGRDIKRITNASDAIMQFSYPYSEHWSAATLAMFGARLGKLEEGAVRIALFRLEDARRKESDAGKSDRGFVARSLHDHYLAISALSPKRGYFPVVLFDPQRAYFELGFYVHHLSVGLCRTVGGVVLKSELAEASGLKPPKDWECARLFDLDLSGYSTRHRLVEKYAIRGSTATFMYSYTAHVERNSGLVSEAKGFLNFLDVKQAGSI